MAHHHFTRSDRVLLYKLKLTGLSNKSCARILGFHTSSIGRELKRGAAATQTGYSARTANKRARLLRLAANQQHRKLYVNSYQERQVISLLKRYYSPDQAGRTVGLSHSTIYRWLWSQSKGFIRSIWKYLRHNKLRRTYGTKRRWQQRELLKKRWIEDRPLTIDQRQFFGHWEGDTVVGNSHSGYLVTLVERKSGYLLAGLIAKDTKEQFRVCVENLLEPLPKHLRQTITLDNGSEMNDYEELEKHIGVMVYFAHPYHSWERGTNENTNGLIRQFFPKNRNFGTITQKELDWAVNNLNTRPRKRHGYISPSDLIQPYLRVAI
jgi:IS30 family transposase